jgi:hypothetical protein
MDKRTAKVEIIDKTQSINFNSASPVLQTESKAEFDNLIKALAEEIRPQGIIEEMYVSDIGLIIWV